MRVLVPMTNTEYAAYVAESVPAYAADKVASGQWSEEESLELSKKSLEELLPQGRSTPENYLFTIVDEASLPVGMLWIAAQQRAGSRIAYVYDVIVRPEHRRNGHATRAFKALEGEVRNLGLSGIALHVFGHNTSAQSLYTKLGYRSTNINMYKPVEAADA